MSSEVGIDFIFQSLRAYRRNKTPEFWRDQLFGPRGVWTIETRIVNQRVVFTADPENMKAMLATQFADYGKGEGFHQEWKEFLGDGIFTTDGAKWQSSRQLIRPQFTRDRVNDLDCFESHVETLFQAMANGGPLDGKRQGLVDLSQSHGRVIEISNLFFRYTLDVATDFLLGADVKSLRSVSWFYFPLTPELLVSCPHFLKTGARLTSNLAATPSKSSPRPLMKCNASIVS